MHRAGSRVSPLAVVALVFSLTGVLALPAVVCGHLAWNRIRKSGGLLTGGHLTITALAFGYFSIIAFITLCLIGASPIWGEGAKRERASSRAFALWVSLMDYQIAYSMNPRIGPPLPGAIVEVASDATLVEILEGKNPQSFRFLRQPRWRFDRSGAFVDGWGRPFKVIYDPSVSRGRQSSISGEPLVYPVVKSAGPDGVFGTTDDVRFP